MSRPPTTDVTEVDPFDLPDWLGTKEVTWRAVDGLLDRGHVRGELTGEDPGERLECDLLAIDVAHPAPVADDELRRDTHQAWAHGQVHLVQRDGRLTMAVPGTTFSPGRVLEVVGRIALAVGARPASYAVWLRVGAPGGGASHRDG